MQNRVFFPQSALDQWMIDGVVDVAGTELSLLAEARRYALTEAVRVVQEVTGGTDPNGLLGRVKTKDALVVLGAELMETSMIIGENAYDVVPGWIGIPVGAFADHVASPERKVARTRVGDAGADPKTEEELLAHCLLK